MKGALISTVVAIMAVLSCQKSPEPDNSFHLTPVAELEEACKNHTCDPIDLAVLLSLASFILSIAAFFWKSVPVHYKEVKQCDIIDKEKEETALKDLFRTPSLRHKGLIALAREMYPYAPSDEEGYAAFLVWARYQLTKDFPYNTPGALQMWADLRSGNINDLADYLVYKEAYSHIDQNAEVRRAAFEDYKSDKGMPQRYREKSCTDTPILDVDFKDVITYHREEDQELADIYKYEDDTDKQKNSQK